MNKSSFKTRNNTGNMQRSNIGTVGMMRQSQHSQQNNNMQQQSNTNQQHTNMQQQMNQQQYNQQQQQYYQQQQLAQQHHQQQQQQYNSQQHGGPQQGSVGMQHRGSVGMQHPHQQQQMGGGGQGMQQQQMNNGQQQNVVQQLNQKNHRLAKELSDLRVRHREETKVVSRLTMENMNLASRCREAISQVAALKKEVLVYQKKQSEWSTLQKEVMALRKQIDKNTTGSSGGGSKKEKELSSSNAGSPGSSLSLNGHHKKQPSGGSSGIGVGNTSNNLENNNADRSDSPATDLDRIMSRQFRKTSSDKSGSTKLSTKADKSTGSSKATSPTATSKSTNKLASANTKIPISVTSSKSKTTTTSSAAAAAAAASQKDDEFDADIDMVDFFAKSQLLNSSSPDTTPSSSADTSPSTRLGSRKTYSARKPKSTDDHMPSDVVVSPNGSSPKGVGKKKSPVSDNLLSSLDAFEASFASAFPETSFSITSNITTPSASNRPSMDMSFDVPEFDPFFKSPNTSHHTRDSSLNSSSIGSKSSGVNGSTSNKSSSVSSPKIQDLFPESAMIFKSSTSPKLDVAFNPATSGANMGFTPIEKKGGGGGGGSSSATKPKKLDAAFSSAKKDSSMPLSPQTMSAEIEQLDAIANLTTSQNENATTSASSGAATIVAAKTNLRAVRKVKQPVSYAEPSTKSKLRRGDVLFPKVDVSEKNKMGTGGIKSTGSTSPTTDLDRIMGQITSSTATSPPPPDVQ